MVKGVIPYIVKPLLKSEQVLLDRLDWRMLGATYSTSTLLRVLPAYKLVKTIVTDRFESHLIQIRSHSDLEVYKKYNTNPMKKIIRKLAMR